MYFKTKRNSVSGLSLSLSQDETVHVHRLSLLPSCMAALDILFSKMGLLVLCFHCHAVRCVAGMGGCEEHPHVQHTLMRNTNWACLDLVHIPGTVKEQWLCNAGQHNWWAAH